ncbi:MAG: carbohydrate ABC transporter permease [Eubacteriales bacterium]|nr:carbohydrate ABC transporter permease [Eubacteriales bacterium]
MNKLNSKNQRIFNVVLTGVMVLIMLITVYPVWYSLINSLNSAADISKNGYALLWIRDFTWESWKTVLNDPEILKALFTTFSRTLIVTVLQTLITSMFAYGFSRPNLTGKKFYAALGFLCMYLNGGVIAYFILFNALNLYDTFWVYIIPSLFGGFYNVIIFNANFKAIPESLFESAKMDGASEPVIFFRIVLPLSKPVLSALGIFTAVGMWNDYTQTLYYTKSEGLQTLSYYTLSLMKSSEAAANLSSSLNGSSMSSILSAMSEAASNYKTIELACMILSAIPLIIMYPFAQKFFEKGVMVGSVKG